MKKLMILSICILSVSSVSQALIYWCPPLSYDFEDPNIKSGMALQDQDPNSEAIWRSVAGNSGVVSVRNWVEYAPEPNSNKYAATNSSASEQLISAPTAGAGTSLFNFSSSDTKFRITYSGMMMDDAGYLVGIWMDGVDGISNSTGNTEVEHVLQFGISFQSHAFRVRGLAGLSALNYIGTLHNGFHSDPNDPNVFPIRLTLDVDLEGNGGSGSMSLTTKDLLTDTETQDPNLQNVDLGFLDANGNPRLDANSVAYSDIYGDPSKWSGWYIRNQRWVGGDNPSYTIGYNTADNLTIAVGYIPEPATLGLISLGSLALLRRRRGPSGGKRIRNVLKSTHVLIGCLVLFMAAFVANAAEVTYVSSEDTYVEWTKNDGDTGNKNGKGYLKQQWSSPDPNINPYHGDVCKAYLKFAIPEDVVANPDGFIYRNVTLALTSQSTQDNNGDQVQFGILPDSMDGWSEDPNSANSLHWTNSVSTYGNDPNSRYFSVGDVVSEPNSYCEPNKAAVSLFSLDPNVIGEYLHNNTNGVITLVAAAMAGNSFWENHEDSNYYYQPKLTWDYVPEPASMAILFGGGVLALIRRRRA